MSNNSKEKTKKEPWPTKDAMHQVYEKKMWGKGEGEFYSGEGSHESEIVTPYIAAVKLFLNSFETPLVVCDLGCGDFNIGQQLVSSTQKYVAVDIVQNLIDFNAEKFKIANLEFCCLDIATAKLPVGDCAIVRQVLQHLSNAEVLQVLEKLKLFKYIILTEHLPNGDFVPNKDIVSGQGIRLKKKSGLQILSAPFCFQIKEEKQLLKYVLKDAKGIIVTALYTVF